ncbi:MAG: hypothetical protein WC455_09425 [Dehalococcoidia bacterium]|jgi:hypothetical protein
MNHHIIKLAARIELEKRAGWSSGPVPGREIFGGAVAGSMAGMLANTIISLVALSKVEREFGKAKKFDVTSFPEDISVLSNKEEINKWLKQPGVNVLKRMLYRKALNSTRPGHGFFVEPPVKGGKPAISVKPPVVDEVMRHELGHYSDWKESGSLTKRRGQYRSMISSMFSDPENTPLYRQEVEAWNRAGVPENSPVRMSALATYRNYLLSARTTLIGAAAGALASALLRKNTMNYLRRIPRV